MRCETFHAYPRTIHGGDHVARFVWSTHGLSLSMPEAVAATIRHDAEAVVCRAVRGSDVVVGLMPGGLG